MQTEEDTGRSYPINVLIFLEKEKTKTSAPSDLIFSLFFAKLLRYLFKIFAVLEKLRARDEKRCPARGKMEASKTDIWFCFFWIKINMCMRGKCYFGTFKTAEARTYRKVPFKERLLLLPCPTLPRPLGDRHCYIFR